MPITPSGIGSGSTSGSPSVSYSVGIGSIAPSSSAGAARLVSIPDDESIITSVEFSGVDYTHLVRIGEGAGVSRQMSITGGSKASCRLVLNSKKGFYRPAQGEEVVVWTAAGKWFAGVVDKITEKHWSGTSGLSEIIVDCVDYGALCDRIIVGREIVAQFGNICSIIMYELAWRYFSKIGITYTFPFYGDIGSEPLGDQVWNWMTLTEVMNDLTRKCGGDWRVDFDKNVWPFYPSVGYTDAPFSIEDDDGNWIDMTVERDSSRYRNRVGIKNSHNTRPLWTDTFVVGETGPFIYANPIQWYTMAPMRNKPVVRVNGVVQTVIDFSEIGPTTHDFYWIDNQVWASPSNPPAPGSILTITYPSPLSYVVWAQDDAEIALYGLHEGIEEVKDIPTLDAMQALADAALARRLVRPTSLTITTDREGIEAGMLLSVNSARHAVTGDFLVTKVSSVEQGKKFFRHTITAVDAATQSLGDITAFFHQLVAQTIQPRDRLTQHIIFVVAETIEGITNPGLTTGVKQAIRMAPVNGLLRSCSIETQNVTPTTTDVEIDVLQNGVSIFPDGPKLIWPAGASIRQTVIEFLADPMPVTEGDIFTIEVLQADSNFKDGTIDLAMLVT